MRIAILYEDNRVWIEFSPDKFRELLKKYFKQTGSIDEALDQIIKDIKSETQNK